MEVANAEEAIRANLGPGFDPESVLDQFNSDDLKQIEDLIDSRQFRNLIQEEAASGGSCLPQTNVGYTDPSRVGGGTQNHANGALNHGSGQVNHGSHGNGQLDNPNLKGSPQRVPPSTHPGPPPGFHGNHGPHIQPQQAHQGPAHQGPGHQGPGHQGPGHQGPGHQGPGHQGPGHQGPGHQGHQPGHVPQGHGGKGQFAHTQFPESPPDSGSEPYSPPNDHNHQQHQENGPYNVKQNGMPNMAPGAHHPMYMPGGHGPQTGPPHPHGPPSGSANMHSSVSPPHGQHTSPPHSVQLPGHPPGQLRPYIYPMGVGSEPPKLQHPGVNPAMPLNVQSLPNPNSSMNNLSNQPAKKRKFSDSPNSTINQHYIQQMVACMPNSGLNIKQEPGLIDCSEDDYYDPQMFMDGAFQVIKWQSFQQNKWCTVLDENGKELPPINYRVDADKGFNFSPSDDSFVCQKKNHFQVTVHVGFGGMPKYVKTAESVVKSIDSYALHFNGIKAESTSQHIKVEQSQSDRTKRPFHPVKVEINSDQVNKFTVGRMHFSETTSNNMRKKGKPNPDQRYFMLVVTLHAHHGSESSILAAHKSERIIVRASNPGQFDSDVDVLWNKGRSPDSVVHMGRVGINHETPDEALTVHGNIHLTGSIVQPSDKRAKTDIRELDTKEQLKNINLMRVYKYHYDERFANFAGLTDDEKEDTGVLAQELAEVLPDAVKETGDVLYPDGEIIENFMVVNKDRIFMESIGAVKELCKVTDKLETRICEIEGMDRKLHKKGTTIRDSMISTCSSVSYSTCSTISRNSSLRPPSDSKPSDKKLSDQKSSSTEKSSRDKSSRDKSSSSSGGKSDGSKSHHHHRHHHRHHHSSSRAPPPPPPHTDGPCNNRLIQITVIVLVLVMAFCLISITVMYILERNSPQSQSQVESTPEFNTTPSDLSTTPPGTFHIAQVIVPTVKPPVYPTNDTVVPQLIPPRCHNHKCNVTCCGKQGQPFNDPSKAGPTKKPEDPRRKSQDTGHKEDTHPPPNDPPYKILPPEHSAPPGGSKPEQAASADVWHIDNEDEPARDVPRLTPGNYSDHQPHPNSTKKKKKPLVIHHMDKEDDPPMDDPVMINDIQDDYVDVQPSVEISNQPQLVVMHSGRNSGRKRRETEFHKYPATLLITQINKTIDEIYCVNTRCHEGGNYSYSIPISSVFPPLFITVHFQLERVASGPMQVFLCEEQEIQVCDELFSDGDVTIKASKNLVNKWDLPIGFYFTTDFKFRVAGEDEDKDEVCQQADTLAGQTYSEYNLHFQRICDDLPSV